MNYLDLFSGCGGFRKGLQEAGFTFDWEGHSEIDKYASSVYERHYPQSEVLGDVNLIRTNELPRINLVTFGFPCQDLSIAGKRKGLSGQRSGLFYRAMQIIRELRPDYFIFENVKGLFSSNDGRDFIEVLREVADSGYDGQWQMLDTAWFLPHDRSRIYFVGYPRGTSRREIFPFTRENKITIGERQFIDLVLHGAVTTSRTRTRTLQSSYNKGYSSRLGDSSGVLVGTYRTHNDGKGFREIKSGNCPTLPARSREDGSGQPVIAIPILSPDRLEKRQNGRRMKENGDNCHTLTVQDRHGIFDGYRVRRFTPKECERLQGFPDDWTRWGKNGEEISDSQRYKMLGNAVSVPVVKAVAERLRA